MAKKIIILASGKGSNAKNIISYFENMDDIEIDCIITNKENAGVVEVGKGGNIPVKVAKKSTIDQLHEKINTDIDLIVLAGFLLKIPVSLIQKFSNKIINIHPSLLPKFGGKGMYGMYVHQAVIEAQEKESGITIHFVNEEYDKGKILLQEKCIVDENETPETLSQKIRLLEHEFLPKTIEKFLRNEL